MPHRPATQYPPKSFPPATMLHDYDWDPDTPTTLSMWSPPLRKTHVRCRGPAARRPKRGASDDADVPWPDGPPRSS
ncbi:MAG: hypothetical protein Q9193_004416, partial [Seirophora villosa]